MRRPHYILLPANSAFIALTLLLAFFLNLLPWGLSPIAPDFVALVLVFWCIYQPRKVGITIAFCLGLLMDVHDSTLLGQHALAYTFLAYTAIMIHRRVLWFSPLTQALHVLPLLLLTQLLQLVVQMIIHGKFPGWEFFYSSMVSTLLWPLLCWLLLAPQRRAVNRDENRPI
ncbi:rod shape-determining protein MreD [Glaciimonas soli]|uniref:Rod shape-determining protein MreD n=1 Tax=Glaciimonas soli TaxID=2590999 RepID=A0A843YVA1_9BURK|nr:rod shape-determining protein MreD [Glaciimonas soli]MQR00536.1 rod shape-determining protein MreD [Glaciimonas soli]